MPKGVRGFQKGHPDYFKGHSEETRRKMSLVRKGKKPYEMTDEIRKKMRRARLKRKKRLGYINSLETRKKISEAQKGRKLSDETKRKMKEIYRNRTKLSLKMIRKKLSEAHKEEKHWNWKGGITPINKRIRMGIEFRLWREAIFARDNWICQKCKKRGIYLHPHHIQNFAQYPEQRFAIDNGITFCRDCHKEFHKKYGKRNNTKQQSEEFLYGNE